MHRIALVILLALAGCRTAQPQRTLTIPTPQAEYSQPRFHPTWEPPQ